jgi:predicted metal-dependent hydrolase
LRTAIEVDGKTYPATMYVERRRNCTVSIGKRSVNIRIPSQLNAQQRAAGYKELEAWAVKYLRGHPDAFKQPDSKKYCDGQTIAAGGEEYTLSIVTGDSRTSRARIEGRTIRITVAAGLPEAERDRHVSALIASVLSARRLPEIERRIRELNEKHFRREFGKVSLRNMKTRWGSCTRRGDISISTALLLAPDDVLDYVCIHELAHLTEPNHSPHFWALVERAMPDYKEKKEWLKRNTAECRF